LSYIRTYQAGHSIPSYQPETAYRIFTRALFNLDIATGTQSTAGSIEAGGVYTSTGRTVPDVQLKASGQGLTYCYTYAASSCYDRQIEMIRNGTAEICNWLFVDKNTTQLFPDVIARCRADWATGGNGSTTPSTPNPTQVFEGHAAVVLGRSWMSVAVAGFLVVMSLL
jgi:hypothetical protein